MVSDLLRSLYSRWRDFRTPDYVEKASRRERWKRTGWELASKAITIALYAIVAEASITFYGQDMALLAVAALGIVSTQAHVFYWGLERFDIVTPWEFRDVDARQDREQ